MPTFITLKKDTEELQVIHDLITTYQEIAARKMQEIRDSVLKKRDFYADINKIYQEVTLTYQHDIKKLMEREHKDSTERLSLLKRNGKTVRVFLSANTGLFGDIIQKVLSQFLQDLQKDPNADIVIVGNLGKTLFEENSKRPYRLYSISDQTVNLKEFEECIANLVQYERIYIYHGQFQSLVTQIGVATDLSGGVVENSLENAKVEEKRYYFEPSLEEIVTFFEQEIFTVLMEQAAYESALSKYASRMVALEQAVDNVRGKVKLQHQESLRMKHDSENKKQLNALSSTRMIHR